MEGKTAEIMMKEMRGIQPRCLSSLCFCLKDILNTNDKSEPVPHLEDSVRIIMENTPVRLLDKTGAGGYNEHRRALSHGGQPLIDQLTQLTVRGPAGRSTRFCGKYPHCPDEKHQET